MMMAFDPAIITAHHLYLTSEALVQVQHLAVTEEDSMSSGGKRSTIRGGTHE